MEKGEEFKYLGYTIMMCLNNDGIVLISPDGSHSGNFGTDVPLVKKYALINYMLDKPELKATLASRLAGHRGHWGDYSRLKKEVEKDGLEMPTDIEQDSPNFMIVL